MLHPCWPSPECTSLWLLSSPGVSQGELHRYCAAASTGELASNSQSQKASDVAPHQLPGNDTDCGWAPFGEFSPVTDMAAPAGFFHRR